MRNSLPVGGIICPETYHGTRMDKKALEFHTQLHEWSEAQRISAHANRHAQMLSNARQKEIYLPFKKLAQIEHWTNDVNRFYRPYKGVRPKSGHFMKIDVTKYNMKVDKKHEATRSKSVIYSTAAKGQGYRVLSAVSTSPGGAKPKYFGTDIHTVNSKLVESQMHYSAQRREIRSAGTTRRQITSAKTCDTKTDTDANLSVNVNGLDKAEPSESETLSTFGNTSTKQSTVDSHSPSQHEGNNLQQKITARSWSNRMLNVISIDDCKLTCRYRPQKIKESHNQDLRSEETDKHEESNGESMVGEDGDKLIANSDKTSISSDTDIESIAVTLDVKLNRIVVGDTIRDNNNNLDDIQQSNGSVKLDSLKNESDDSARDINLMKSDDLDSSNLLKPNSKKEGIHFEDNQRSSNSNESKSDKRRESNSSQSNKTSYGRITPLYTHTHTSKSTEKPKKKKKVTRTAKINHAINDMVNDRKVMNSMARDFDTRTAEFGRTTVEKSEGSELFQKLHSNLRKRMDTFLETHSAVKTSKYHEMKRKNSVHSQT